VLFNQVFWCDGLKYWVYDSQLDSFEEMRSKAAGALPLHGKLIETWRQRLLIARTEDDPHNVYGSRMGDPFDFDEFPVNPDQREAFSFGNTQVGRSADIINALIPYSDDLLIIGGDHTIQRLTGDPNAGGQLDDVSTSTGIAYGRAWARSEDGFIFFFGSRGGVYAMSPGSQPKKITVDLIDRRMSEVDLENNTVRLLWDTENYGLHVLVIPNGQPDLALAPPERSWFMDRDGAWWEDTRGLNTVMPTAAVVSDGDLPDDRVTLFGCADGFVRQVSTTAKSDDGVRVAANLLIGPMAGDQSTQQVAFIRPQVTLGADQDGCDFEFYASDTAEDRGVPVAGGRLVPGMNPQLPARARGTAVWIRLYNASTEERFAFERATVGVEGGGKEQRK